MKTGLRHDLISWIAGAGVAGVLAISAALANEAPGTESGMCGGIAGFRCGAGLFCEMAPEARCGAGDMSGICRKTPEVCTEEYNPVCGCDGQTYANDCVRQAAGTGKLKAGACDVGSQSPD